jgi:hypothetical protein
MKVPLMSMHAGRIAVAGFKIIGEGGNRIGVARFPD